MTEVKEKNMETKKNSIAEAIHHYSNNFRIFNSRILFFPEENEELS